MKPIKPPARTRRRIICRPPPSLRCPHEHPPAARRRAPWGPPDVPPGVWLPRAGGHDGEELDEEQADGDVGLDERETGCGDRDGRQDDEMMPAVPVQRRRLLLGA